MAMRARVRFKADDIWEMPEDDKRYEVINGELCVSPPPIVPHQGAAGALFGYIWEYLRRNPIGQIWMAPVGVVLDEQNGLQPDLVFVSAARLGILTERAIEGAPDLVVEVLSPSTQARDRGVKMKRYAASGVPHYWIVDLRRRALEAYELTDDGYELTGSFETASVFRPRLFPGLEIPIDELWS